MLERYINGIAWQHTNAGDISFALPRTARGRVHVNDPEGPDLFCGRVILDEGGLSVGREALLEHARAAKVCGSCLRAIRKRMEG
jgi:hypothetical protein